MSTVKTTLQDPENNLIARAEKNGNVSMYDVIKSIEFRIKRHTELIKNDRLLIVENIDFNEIISDAILRITERETKIHELRELLRYSFKFNTD